MRIIGGQFGGRVIQAPEGTDTRPTSDRARQALFNILEHGGFAAGGSAIAGARVIDAFAGTGALGLEALSRGAAYVTFFENAPSALASLKANIARLGVAAQARIVAGNACKPPAAKQSCGLAFLDAPYGTGFGVTSLEAMAASGWLAEGALVVLEVAARETVQLPPDFLILDERIYGAARLVFARHPPPRGDAAA